MQVNTFQAVLVYNSEVSIVFFFYEETTVRAGSAVVGISSDQGVFRNSEVNNFEENGNTGVPGFYAYRVDTSTILQPGGIINHNWILDLFHSSRYPRCTSII